MIIVKLGGSVICDKNKPFSFRKDIVKQIVYEISFFYPKKDIIIVHGGGSFGHPLAKKYGIREGLKENEKKIGFSYVHHAMLELNKKILDIFLEEKLPAFSLSPSSMFLVEKGEIVYGEIKIIEELIQRNFIPILFGDVAIAIDKGIDILSGDQIISYLANKLMVEKVIFLMDVDGIYDKHPKEKDAKLIEVLDEKSIKFNSKNKGFDVTGGIRNKIEEALKMHCPVYFINGMIKGNLKKAIEGKKVGTMKK